MLFLFAVALTLVGSLLVYLTSPNQSLLQQNMGKLVRLTGLSCFLLSAVIQYSLMQSAAAIFQWTAISMFCLTLVPHITTLLLIKKHKSK